MSNEPEKLTYKGVSQAEIVLSLKNLQHFINKIDIVGTDILKKEADLIALPDGYIDRIAKATTAEELAKAVNTYSKSEEALGYGSRAFEHALQTYAALRFQDKDPLGHQAYMILEDLWRWGGMPSSGLTVMSGEDSAADAIFKAKKEIIDGANGYFSIMPHHAPQLQWTYYVHPRKGVTRDDLAQKIGEIYQTLKADKTTGIDSEIPWDGHERMGGISKIKGSERVIKAVQEVLRGSGLTNDDSFELVTTPEKLPKPQDSGFTRGWMDTYSMRRYW